MERLQSAKNKTHSETRTYRWQCPICGTSRLGVYDTTDGFRAVNALRTHIRATDDSAHGSTHQLPASLDAESLTDCISHRESTAAAQ
ncbi:hypothetical protein halTADL_1173 [Halohasta litchfieldiae]|jgi:hypothetical protein|uniref:Uncharacterized protein n=1 Tax=Halohasta litchfieldiae TaxID=1073996 RepID=A0A1H6S674_9EURY|nr:hypothetical protein [Halohasta litchfieldiae]ATW87966.1 hypothetical protein halTADL_1173 [Halohasta litchfieldiae]SEI61374.1 hypothetical protein SAMN05444271_10421 [Halohasta litchfieldiae]